MGGLFDKFAMWVKEFFADSIVANIAYMFDYLNAEVGKIAAEVGKSPQDWNPSIFEMIKKLSETVIIPIAGMIITFVLCYELITLITEKNNMHDIDTFMFFKYVFKMCIAVYLVTHTFDITMAIFDVGTHIVSSSAGIINGSTDIDFIKYYPQLKETLMMQELHELIGLFFTTFIIQGAIWALILVITFVLYGRIIEIYLYCSIAPIPFATMSNKEGGNIGTNYIKSMCALGLQGFFILICVSIYSVLAVNFIADPNNLTNDLLKLTSYTILLAFSLLKTGSISKAILNVH